ncbi:MAG: leucine-rich repeat protein [Abditibacteriota bacterium]|nr:leucine-rich repeat protein [Abditibacteriota bacterium]
MRKILTLIITLLLVFGCLSTVFAGKMIIKNHVLVKYKPNKMLNSYTPKPEFINTLAIPEGVTSIGPNAFSEWSGKIDTISLPSTLKSIAPQGMFEQYHGDRGGGGESIHLEKIIVNSNNKTYCSVDGVLFDKKMTKLIYYPDQKTNKTYTIPSTVSYIPKNAFPENLEYDTYNMNHYHKHYLKELIIPKNVKRLASYSICCLNLEKLTIENPNIIIEKKAFASSFYYKITEDCNIKTELYAPEKVESYFYPATRYDDDYFEVYESYAVDPVFTWDI